MKNKLCAAFPACVSNSCIKTENTENIFIVDDAAEQKAYIYQGTIDSIQCAYFWVVNKIRKNIHFLAIDKCVFTDSVDERCDFALFDENIFCFIEIKGRNRQKKARSQLIQTIRKFKENIDFTGYVLEAYPCAGYPGESRPRASASGTAMAIEFDDIDVEMFKGNQREFT